MEQKPVSTFMKMRAFTASTSHTHNTETKHMRRTVFVSYEKWKMIAPVCDILEQ